MSRGTVEQMQEAREELIERLFASKLMQAGQPFGTKEMVEELGIPRQSANNLLHHLNNMRKIHLEKDSSTRRLVCKGRRCNLAYRSWRTKTNHELGIR